MNTRQFSKRQEKRVAKFLGGKINANSGATPFIKSDVKVDGWVIECKTKASESKQVTIKKEWLDKLKNEAFATGQQNYSLVFDFGNGEDYYVVPAHIFKHLIKEA